MSTTKKTTAKPKPAKSTPKTKAGSKPPSQRPPKHGGGTSYNDNTHQ